MANPLTGGFEAVVLIAPAQINGLLATLHARGDDADAPLRLLHGGRFRIGFERLLPDVAGVGDWAATAFRDGPGRDAIDWRTDVVSGAPAGLTRRLKDALGALDAGLTASSDPLRGTADVQISTVGVSFGHGATDAVTIEADLRARFSPALGSASLPDAVHGRLRATFTVRVVTSPGGRRLHIAPSTDDGQIRFHAAAGSGTTGPQVADIERALRRTLRDGLTLLPVDLPASFPFSEFRAIGTDASQLIALPVSLTGAAVSGDLASLTAPFADGRGLAVAVSAEHLRGLVDVEALRTAVARRPITFRIQRFGIGLSVSYRLRFSVGPDVTLADNGIEISGRVEADTSTPWAPNGFVQFRQGVTLTLDPSGETVRLATAGPPDVDESWFIPHATALDIVESEMARALADLAPAVRATFGDVRQQLVGSLRRFDSGATLTLTDVAVSPHGVVVRGTAGSASARAPVVRVVERTHGELSALESWIPGGWIERFVWSWVEYPAQSPTFLSGQVRSATHSHDYVLKPPAGLISASQVCLRIEGVRVRADGSIEPVIAGATCEIPEPELELAVPSWWEPLAVPAWAPDLAPDARLSEAIVAHVDVHAGRASAPGRRRNTLLAFVDLDEPHLESLARAWPGLARRGRSLSVLLVTPRGTFDRTRRDVEARISVLAGVTASPAQLVEDRDGAWRRAFAVETDTAWVLVDAHQQVVWTHRGELEAPTLAAAVATHAVPLPRSRHRVVVPEVAAGHRAPDLVLDDDRGVSFAVHRSKGIATTLVFFQPWSEPSMDEVQRVQSACGESTDAARVYAVLGTATDDVGALGRRLGITLPILADFEHRLARRYGVRCWPTTVVIDEGGRIARIAQGARRRDRLGAAVTTVGVP